MLRNVNTPNRLVFIIVFAVLPMLVLTVYGTIQQRTDAETEAKQQLRLLARLAARQQAQVIDGANDTLVAVAQLALALPPDPSVCSAHFSQMLKRSGNKYHNIGVHTAEGDSYCSGLQPGRPGSSRDRLYVRLARETGKFSIGEYQIGRMSGRAGLNFGYPVLADDGLRGIAFLALDLDEFLKGTAALPLPPGGVLLVFDGNGTIIARQPADAGRVGIKVRSPDVHRALVAPGAGMFEGPGSDGVLRIFATEAVVANADGSTALKVSISVPKHLIFEHANADLVRDLAGILCATVLLIVLGRFGAERFVLRHIRTLLAMAERVRSGDFSARTGMRPGREELSQIGSAMDSMADALQERESALQTAVGKLVEQATTDALTGLHNRRHLEQHLPLELVRAQRRGDSFAVVMVDADHFKRLNDTYGHDGGDVVLKEVANTLKANIRAGDLAFRYGGEEFVVVLSNTGPAGARDRAEALRAAIGTLDVRHNGRPIGPITASFGVAIFPDHGRDGESLIRAADAALYAAKAAGRNRVMVASR
jgi:diguanylate cyclase (GGDEF)-like protein